MKDKSLVSKKPLTRSQRKAVQKIKKLQRKMIIVLFGVYIKTIKAKLGISESTADGKFQVSARAIYNGLLANVGGFYTPPFGQMVALLAAIDKFDIEKQNVKDGVAGAEAAKKAAKKSVMLVLKKALNYINNLCLDNQKDANEIITGCKMIPINDTRREKQDISARQGTSVGEVLLDALALKYKGKYVITTYYWQYSIDDGKTWEDMEETQVAKTSATGMLPGIPTLFRKRTRSRKTGLSPWSDAILFYPQG